MAPQKNHHLVVLATRNILEDVRRLYLPQEGRKSFNTLIIVAYEADENMIMNLDIFA